MKTIAMIFAGIGLLAALSGCTTLNTTSGDADMKTVTVEAFYRERMMLPPNAVLKVSLSDVAKMDVAATLINEVTRENPGAPPYQVELSYDPDVITHQGRYSVRATISADGKLLFTSTTMIDAFKPDANGTVHVMMQRVKAAPTSSGQGKAQASLTNTYWKLMTLAGKPADIGAGGRELRLQLVEKDTRYHGFSGCNNYNGGYTLKPDNGLELGPAAGTRKACIEGMEQEHAYLQILDRVSSYAIEGESLRLLDADGAELATFESRYMQ